MLRSFAKFIFATLILILGVIAYSRIQDRLTELTNIKSCEPMLELKNPGETLVELSVPALEPELRIVKMCQGQTNRDMIDEHGEKFSAAVPRTILFFASNAGTPEIITTKFTNAENRTMNRDYGVVFEHGRLDDLKQIADSAAGRNRYESLIVEAADLCLGAYTDVRQYEIDFGHLKDEIENQSTAYLEMDFDLQSPDTDVLLYYKLGGKIFQKDLSRLTSPI